MVDLGIVHETPEVTLNDVPLDVAWKGQRRLACLARRMSCRAVSPVRTGELSSFLVGSSLIVHPSLLPRSVARARGEPETQTVASVAWPSYPISAEPGQGLPLR